MATHPYLGPGNAVIDTCSACELIWLDYGELTQLVEAPGRDRGVPLPEPQESPSDADTGNDILQVRDGHVEIDLSNLLGRLFG
jgi:Zn-finger nucleic acid-binding protein